MLCSDCEVEHPEVVIPESLDDSGKCDECGKTKDRVILRLNLRDQDGKPPRLCDPCHAERRS